MGTAHWFRHAFALDPEPALEPDQVQRAVIERLLAEVVRRRLTTPALLALELCRPLNFVSAQALHFFQPLVATVTDASGYDAFTRFVEQRGSVDYLCARLDTLEQALEPGPGASTR